MLKKRKKKLNYARGEGRFLKGLVEMWVDDGRVPASLSDMGRDETIRSFLELLEAGFLKVSIYKDDEGEMTGFSIEPIDGLAVSNVH